MRLLELVARASTTPRSCASPISHRRPACRLRLRCASARRGRWNLARGCGTVAAVSTAELVREAHAAIARGDYDAVAPLLDPAVCWHAGNPQEGCRSREQALAWIRRAGSSGRPLPEIVRVVEAGEHVVVVLQRHPSAAEPDPPRTANLTTLRRGLVVEMVHYDDAESALAELSRLASSASASVPPIASSGTAGSR